MSHLRFVSLLEGAEGTGECVSRCLSKLAVCFFASTRLNDILCLNRPQFKLLNDSFWQAQRYVFN